MNPSSAGIWCNPPPPGTDEDLSNSSIKKEKVTPERVIDRIDPYLKSSEYIKYEKKRRSRSRSRSRHHRRRSGSRSKGRHRRHRRRYSSSRSRSRSRSRRRHKRSRHSRSRSRSRSRRHRRRSHSRPKEPKVEERRPEVEEEVEDDDDDGSNENVFKNDGSFLEMFKKMQEEQLKQKEEEEAAPAEAKVALPTFGKRRGGKILKTGMVQKSKTPGQEDGESQDAWTLYMKEVKRYKEACCDDDSKTRLLVK